MEKKNSRKKRSVDAINRSMKLANLRNGRVRYPRRRVPATRFRPPQMKDAKEEERDKRVIKELSLRAPEQPETPEIPERLTPIILWTYTPQNTGEKRIEAELYKVRLNPYKTESQTLYIERTDTRTKRLPIRAIKSFPDARAVQFRGETYKLESFMRAMLSNELEFYHLEDHLDK